MKRSAAVILGTVLLTFVATVAPAAAGTDVATTIEVVVKIEPGHAIEEVTATHDGSVVEAMIESRGIFVVEKDVLVDAAKVEEKADAEAKDWAKDLEKDDAVVWAEPVWQESPEDMRFHAWPDDDYTTVSALGGSVAFDYLDLESVHQTATGEGVVVAVLDTGIDMGHPYFAGRILPGYDLVGDDADPTDEGDGIDNDGDGAADEAYGHGTFVSGVVLQIAPDATILPIRVLDADGRAEIPTVVEGIYMAIEAGADVINLSFGLNSDEKPESLKDALKAAKENEVVVVAAAGNSGDDAKRYPASESSVVSVGAIDVEAPDVVAGFSSHGKWVLLAAPGVDIVSTVPGGGYAIWAGTSMATPVVAGQAALLRQVDPDAKRKDVEKALKDSARKMHGQHKAEKGVIDILESLADMA